MAAKTPKRPPEPRWPKRMDAETRAHWERLGFIRPIYSPAQCGFDTAPTPQEFAELMGRFGVPQGKGSTLETWLRVCGSANSLWGWMNCLPQVKESLQSPIKQHPVKTRPLRKWLDAGASPQDMAQYIHAFGNDVVRAHQPRWVVRLEREMGLRRALVWRQALHLTFNDLLHTAAWACYYQFHDVFFPAVDELIAEDYLHTAQELQAISYWARNMRVRTKKRLKYWWIGLYTLPFEKKSLLFGGGHIFAWEKGGFTPEKMVEWVEAGWPVSKGAHAARARRRYAGRGYTWEEIFASEALLGAFSGKQVGRR